jgi:hypothetical protein
MQTKFTLSYVPSFEDDEHITFDAPCVYDLITSIRERALDCCTPEELFEEGE